MLWDSFLNGSLQWSSSFLVCVCVKSVMSFGYFTLIQLEQGAWDFSTRLTPTKTPVEKCEIILGRQNSRFCMCQSWLKITQESGVLKFYIPQQPTNLSSVFWVNSLTCEHRRSASCGSRSGHRPPRWIVEDLTWLMCHRLDPSSRS